MEAKQKALIGLLKFAQSSPKEVVKFAKETLSELKDHEFRQFLRAVGYFTVEREEYFVREYNRLSQSGVDDSKLSAIKDYTNRVEEDFTSHKNVKQITFRKPNETRMKIAYDVLAGWFLKFLYKKFDIIPLAYNNGAGWLYAPENTLEETELWKQFLEWLPKDHIAGNIEMLLNFAVKKQIGQIVVPSIYADTIASSLVELVNKNPRFANKFQNPVRTKLSGAKTSAEKKDALCKSISVNFIKPPFQFSNYGFETSSSGRGINKCIACEDSNAIPKMGTKLLLPESKQRGYESISDAQPALCSECFLAGFLSGLYPSSGTRTGYAICELPLSNLYETFFFAEQMSGLTASLGVIQITNSSLLTILPTKYFVVSLSTGRGRLPKKTQLYLILKEHEKIFSNFEHVIVHVPEAGPISSTRIYIPLLKLLALFSGSVLPSHYTTDGNQKARVNDVVQLLERGKPYTALYRLIYRAMQDKKQKIKYLGESNVFKSPLVFSDFDDTVNKEAKQLLMNRLIEGREKMIKEEPKEFYGDVKNLSDKIYDLVKPIAEDEVKDSRSKVSVIVRKYTDIIKYSFPKLNIEQLQYLVAQRADKAEKRRLAGEQVFIEGKEKVQAKLEEVENKILELYDKYYTKGNMYLWREYIKEVEARLLSKLLLNIRGVGGA